MLIRHVQFTLKPGKADEFWKIGREAESQAASMEGVGTTYRFVDPNNPDTDLDFLADGDDPNPIAPDFDTTLDEPRITEDAVFESKRLLVRGGLKVDNGAVARFTDCELVFDDSDNFQSFIAVTKGSTLSAENCRLRSIDGRNLYLINVTGSVKMVDCDLSDGYAWRFQAKGAET